jgi:hypothetical protein
MGTKMVKAQSPDEMQMLVNTYLGQGYDARMITPGMSQLSKGGGIGNVCWHIVILLILPIIGNFIYGLVSISRKQTVNIILEELSSNES